jgi:hypothetical protein
MSELTVGQLRGLTINDNIVTVPSGHKLYAPGHVVQVKYVTYSTQTSYSVTSYSNIASVAITPTSSSSIIAVSFSFLISGKGGLRIRRNDSVAWIGPGAGTPYSIYQPTTAINEFNTSERQLQSFTYFDAPNTSASINYSLDIQSYVAGTAAERIGICEGGTPGYFYVMEIAQ